LILGPRACSLGALAPSVSSWTPAALAELRALLDPAQGYALDAGRVVQLLDASPVGGNVEQSTALLRPLYVASDAAFGGQPSVEFDGSRWLASSVALGACPSGWTQWVVARVDTHASVRVLCDSNAHPFARLFATVANEPSSQNNSIINGAPALDASAHLWLATYGDGWQRLYVDGVLAGETLATILDPWASSGWRIGADRGPWDYLRGAIAHAGVVAGVVGAPTRDAFVTWSRTRFGTP
jgi:hypothetical protein